MHIYRKKQTASLSLFSFLLETLSNIQQFPSFPSLSVSWGSESPARLNEPTLTFDPTRRRRGEGWQVRPAALRSPPVSWCGGSLGGLPRWRLTPSQCSLLCPHTSCLAPAFVLLLLLLLFCFFVLFSPLPLHSQTLLPFHFSGICLSLLVFNNKSNKNNKNQALQTSRVMKIKCTITMKISTLSVEISSISGT